MMTLIIPTKTVITNIPQKPDFRHCKIMALNTIIQILEITATACKMRT